MRHFCAPRRWRLLLGSFAVVLIGLTACSGPFPQSTLAPKGDFARTVDHVFMLTVYLAVGVFVLVEGALLLAIFKFRGKPGDAEPKQIHGSTVVEVIWTIIPAVVLAVVAVPTVQAIFKTAEVPTVSVDGHAPLKVEVIGHQWWWEFRYPELGITTANELHVPLNRTIDLRMKSVDVIHSFWVPQFAGKRDVFPNRETRIWFTPNVTGAFPGACAEFCGVEHARMDFYLMVDAPEDFAAWTRRRQADSALAQNGLPVPPVPAPAEVVSGKGKTPAVTAPPVTVAVDPLVAEGEKLVLAKGCTGCHSFNSVNPTKGTIGPNLSGVGTRKMIAAGWLTNTDDNLKRWLQHTKEVKPGVGMVIPPISDSEAAALIAFLRTKR
jgi:cytochrome c oxidase subunit 2